jgi:hypothetical protein
MKIDICEDRTLFYIQTNNELDPYSACQCTAMAAGLDVGKFSLRPILILKDKYRQPEDKLRNFILTDPAVQDFYRKSHGRTEIPAPEWADCMVYAVNRLYGKRIVYFEPSITRAGITADLGNGLPIYCSMQYKNNRNNAGLIAPVDGHIVLIVGIDDNGYIINDPYKNHLTGAADGYKNYYTEEQFKAHSKGRGIRYIAC